MIVLSLVSHDELVSDTHAIVTAAIPPESKTRLLTDLAVRYREQMNILDWKQADGVDRAFIQLSEPKVAALAIGLETFNTDSLTQEAKVMFDKVRPELQTLLRRSLELPPLPSDATQAPARA